MIDLDLLHSLRKETENVAFENKDEFDILRQRAEIIVRKVFGDESHYLVDLKKINTRPAVGISGLITDYKKPFESGLRRFKDVLQIMMEDIKISSNYNNPSITVFNQKETKKDLQKNGTKEIKVLIASPGDVIRERELLMDKLETKFRRDFFEERCGARILVSGWEEIPSQSGYAQDIINSDLVSNSNIIIGVFRHKLGTPTIDTSTNDKRAESGTTEELLYAIRNKKIPNPPLGMAYFYANAPSMSFDSIDFDKMRIEWERVKKFKEEIRNEILYKTYKIEEELLDLVCKDLSDNIKKYF